ncbi:RecX family transcriptional regulator [Adlercreutzia sp. R25]|uniref:regulatory protein RecX n=1 Tax=Adlercreutzia shanghongiae TaxID=3111773 RepID=UPI002DB9755D|nr:RecX family transcriptional regulator [Adlercreutzia sp. R25]MEC4272416.1 RecX family transcriptional regulator [Adlercreutzia sp. R25]
MPDKAAILASLRADIAALEAGQSAPDSRSDRFSSPEPRDQHARTVLAPSAFELGNGRMGERAGHDAASENEGAADKTADMAYRRILRWVSVRERSSAYLRDRLLKDDFAPADVEEALSRAARVCIVDDRRYADALIRMRLTAGKGLRDAEREIAELGIDPASLDAWIEHHEQGRDFEVQRALTALRRRPPRAKQAREAAFRRLVNQGFATDIASCAARQWYEEREREGDSRDHS